MTSKASIEERLDKALVSDSVIAHRTAVVERYLEGLNEANLEKVAGLFAENAVILDPLGGQTFTGMDEVRGFYANGPFLHPIRSSLDGQVRVAGNSAAFAFTAFSDSKKM